MKIFRNRLAAFVLLLLISPAVFANVTFDRPITIVVSFPTGGDTDVIARVLAEKLSKRINQNVLVLNKSGASGTIGNRFVAESKPDGYTLLLTPSTIITSKFVLGDRISYDIFKDFTPIVKVIRETNLFIVVNSSTNVRTNKELIDAIKQGRIRSYATPGSGSPMNMVGEYYKKELGLDIVQVPYRGNFPAVTALLSNEVSMMITGLFPVISAIESKKVNVIAVASDKRSQFAPEIPTLSETGLTPADFSGWFALMGPAGMNSNIVNSLNYHINEILKDQEVRTKFSGLAYSTAGGSPKDMETAFRNLYNKFDNNIKKFKIIVNVE